MTAQLKEEISNNFQEFTNEWPKQLEDSRVSLKAKTDQFEKSYLRICSIQAWRSSITLKLPEGSEAFFFEAQNDFLVSHCLASCGSFRSSLKSIRAAVENVLFFIYYKDHAIELEKWELGEHRLGFTDLHTYCSTHPKLQNRKLAQHSLATLKNEYSTLSKAVHGSAKSFRMTNSLEEIKLWHDSPNSVGAWATRERSVLESLNMLLLHIFSDQLQGTSNTGLRQVVGLIIPKKHHPAIKNQTGITLIAN